jgi:hypothetical protein
VVIAACNCVTSLVPRLLAQLETAAGYNYDGGGGGGGGGGDGDGIGRGVGDVLDDDGASPYAVSPALDAALDAAVFAGAEDSVSTHVHRYLLDIDLDRVAATHELAIQAHDRAAKAAAAELSAKEQRGSE